MNALDPKALCAAIAGKNGEFNENSVYVLKGSDIREAVAEFLEATSPKGQAEAVAVKPLEWNPYRAETPFGYYHIDDQSDLSAEDLKGREAFLLRIIDFSLARYPTIQAARAAAQADYEARIRSALASPAPAGRGVDGWQTIDCAPKDGSQVILAVPAGQGGGWIVGEAYFDPEQHSLDGGDWWWAGTGRDNYHTDPISECNVHPPAYWHPMPNISAIPAAPIPEGK